MSYFNHAYRKSFLSTKATQSATPGVQAGVQSGFLTSSGIHSRYLSSTAVPNKLGVGTFGFFDPATYLSVVQGDAIVTTGKPLVLAGASVLPNDKIGPFHGGYNESNKSKMINPRYIHRFVKQSAQEAEQNIVQVGKGATTAVITNGGTGFTNGIVSDAATTGGAGTGLTLDLVITGGIVVSASVHDYGIGYVTGDIVTYTEGVHTATFTVTVAAACSFEFLSGETYNLQVNLWGSPVLRLLNHDAYRMYSYNSGCSADIVPTAIDSTLAMIYFAKQILSDKYVNSFVLPTIVTEAGELLTTEAQFDNYTSSGHTAGRLASLILVGAYVDTKFGNCSFIKTDFFEKEIVRMKISLVDLGGDPCVFESLCITEIQPGLQAVGFGETVLRDIILDESYLQNHFADDVRIREITQGDAILSSVDRNALYDRFVILHSVPRYNNPSGVYDNDQYALNIYVPKGATSTSFTNFMSAWLLGANVPVALEVFA